ncbi:hypothetical protein MOMA_08446 [Moraxella macacae 0408225]|uniref:Ribosomal RNA small subunit methyltransferase D n=1 Tax=Moraxella macacae 0408225 TaxID=1230338 RepID=L2F6C5_9GAMM|nr:16S rRNA (guanine(966)-N(2))-methyltransferase RsmD [Moraxella macacae]ELA08577.1 hypothetical protein MOMA_08446 [Moraxella macacae 0408225]
MKKTSKQQISNKQQLSHVRIIAGEYRRRNVGFIDANGLRPTPDRVRETVFNWLADSLVNARVLDCCAGSGVLGFESLSRGASLVHMIEPNRNQFLELHNSRQMLQIHPSKLNIHQGYAENVLPTLEKTAFDMVFIDPPYGLNLWQTMLHLLIDNQLINNNTLIYIEANQAHHEILGNDYARLFEIKYKKMGQIFVGIYQLDLKSSLT